MFGRIRQLDGVRGIAILVVVLHNQRDMFPSLHMQGVFASGWMGVDLFFVLSGFLITGILLDAKGSDGYFRFFYARRCLRIWPLYYSLLLLMFVAVPMLRPADAHTVFEKSSPWWAYPLFLQNVLVPASTNAAGPLAVTWSLAIEEQFYIVWPWVVRYCSTAQLRRLALSVICISPLVRLGLSYQHVDLYTNVFCRLDGLMAGALLAAFVRDPAFVASKYVGRAWWLLVVSLPLALVADAAHVGWLVFSLSAAASAGFVYLALFSSQPLLRAALTTRFIVYTGTISYGLYLLHKIPFDAVKGAKIGPHPVATLAALLVASYVAASVSWQLLEKPVLRLKRFFDNPPGRLDVVRHAPHAAHVRSAEA
jgi:peptidoglycan/LPS O-acetylase OafA/YrhL